MAREGGSLQVETSRKVTFKTDMEILGEEKSLERGIECVGGVASLEMRLKVPSGAWLVGAEAS